MKNKIRVFLFIGMFLSGLVLLLWGNAIMLGYEVQEGQETLKEVSRAARYLAKPQWIPGMILLLGGYVALYMPKFKKTK